MNRGFWFMNAIDQSRLWCSLFHRETSHLFCFCIAQSFCPILNSSLILGTPDTLLCSPYWTVLIHLVSQLVHSPPDSTRFLQWLFILSWPTLIEYRSSNHEHLVQLLQIAAHSLILLHSYAWSWASLCSQSWCLKSLWSSLKILLSGLIHSFQVNLQFHVFVQDFPPRARWLWWIAADHEESGAPPSRPPLYRQHFGLTNAYRPCFLTTFSCKLSGSCILASRDWMWNLFDRVSSIWLDFLERFPSSIVVSYTPSLFATVSTRA